MPAAATPFSVAAVAQIIAATWLFILVPAAATQIPIHVHILVEVVHVIYQLYLCAWLLKLNVKRFSEIMLDSFPISSSLISINLNQPNTSANQFM